MTNEELENTIVNSIVVSTIDTDNANSNYHCKQLSNVERNTEKHTQILMNILFKKFTEYDSNLHIKSGKNQEILIIYIKRWFERYLYTQVNLEVIHLETYIQGLINLIIQHNISKKVKTYIKDILKEFLFYYYNSLNSSKNTKIGENTNFKIFFHNINKLIYEQIEKSLSTRNFENILDYLNIYESLIMRNNLLIYDNDVFDRFICVIELLIKHIKIFKKPEIEDTNTEEDRERNNEYNIMRDISNIIVSILSDNISCLKNVNLAKDLTFYNLFLNNERFVKVNLDYLNNFTEKSFIY